MGTVRHLPAAERADVDRLAVELAGQADLPEAAARTYLMEFANDAGASSPPKSALRLKPEPQSPYEKLAADLPTQITEGRLTGELPRVADIAADHDVSFGTAQRALTVLRNEGLISGSRGQRARVTAPSATV